MREKVLLLSGDTPQVDVSEHSLLTRHILLSAYKALKMLLSLSFIFSALALRSSSQILPDVLLNLNRTSARKSSLFLGTPFWVLHC